MRRQGEYIIDKRLRFKKGLQKKFIQQIKIGSKKSWLELSRYLDLHPYTLRVDWYTEKRTMPKKKAQRLLKLYPFEDWKMITKHWILEELSPKWGQLKGGGRNKKEIKIPSKDLKLAEFIGCALGDGHLDKKEFTLSSDSTQEHYVSYISKLVNKLFGLDSKIFLNPSNKNNLFMDIYSIELVGFLQKNVFPVGNKIENKASFPKWIFKNTDMASAALRGLFDTDGGIYEKQKGYNRAIIEFQTKSPYIRKDIYKLLSILNFNSSKGNSYNIRVQDQNDVHRFFKIIGSSNLKNIIRYKEFVKTGTVPKRDKVINLMKKHTNKINLPFKVS